MKKFLIFLISLVVVVCVGLTTYYFMRNNEIITIKTKEIYCNTGDTIPLKSLGIEIEKANVSKKTKFDYNAGGDDVTKYIKYDEELDSFIVSQSLGGDVTLVISTTNKKYSDFTISVHIGDGSVENPYYIFSETDLNKIGSVYKLDKNYALMKDITLTSNFKPIGYNSATSTMEGFSGVFDGRNHIVGGMSIVDADLESAGMFTKINSGAAVKDLTINKASISGSYKTAGILAGEVNGSVEKVAITNSSILNKENDSYTGSIAGKINANTMAMSYADGVAITLEGTNLKAGGVVGSINEATIQACYANNVEFNTDNATAVVGGMSAEFIIGTNSGSIQQSYVNTTCSKQYGYSAFVGTISKATGFDQTKANMLRHLIGNIAIVYGKASQADIKDTDLIANFDNNYFKNTAYVGNPVFYDKNAALYLVRGFVSAGDVVATNEYIYYAVDNVTLTNWDTTYVWDVEGNDLPILRMGSIAPVGPSGEYLRRDLTKKNLATKDSFNYEFSKDVANSNVKLLADVDLTSGWTPVSVTNTTIDGGNKTITIDLNTAVGDNLGLFTYIENSTIKNLNIIVKNVSANAKYAGALAGIIKSTDNLTTSTVENVNVIYEGFATPNITNFGGIAGYIEKTTIKNSSVSGLSVNEGSQVTMAGALVAENNGHIENCEYSAVLYANEYVGGAVAVNNGTLSKVNGSVGVNYSKSATDAYVGGIVAANNGTIIDSSSDVNISILNVGTRAYVGGMAGINRGTIHNVKVSGEKIETISTNSTVYIGGLVGVNDGNITLSNNSIASIGSYHIGKNVYVGGVAAFNNGSIEEVLTQSDLNGNYVSGVVAVMNNSKASINKVAVGKYNVDTKQLTQSTIYGDKYLAGVVVEFKAGSIANVQAASNIVGAANSTRSSLVTLIFPYGATLKNATINSSLDGYGVKYRESWTDFARYSNKQEFGFSNGETGDERFNVYKYDTYHGSMQSVVINLANKGVSDASAAMGAAFAWGKDYNDSAESSYIKTVNGFNDVSQFQGEFTFVCAKSTLFGINHKATKTLTFGIGTEWESNNGISLIFLNNIK